MLLLYSFSSCRSGIPRWGASLTLSRTAPHGVPQVLEPSGKMHTFTGGKKLIIRRCKHSETSELSEYVLARWYACYFFVFTSIDHTCMHVYIYAVTRVTILYIFQKRMYIYADGKSGSFALQTQHVHIYIERETPPKRLFFNRVNTKQGYTYMPD